MAVKHPPSWHTDAVEGRPPHQSCFVFAVVYVSCPRWLKPLLIAFLALLAGVSAAPAQTRSLDELVAAVVRVKATIESDGRTVEGLGREREGSGVLIDNDGLVLTIGYLMVEAQAAEIGLNDGRTVPASVVGYDHETGFGLLRALLPIRVSPVAFGKSAEIKERDAVLVASFGGAAAVAPARVVAKREFAGSWEYLLDEAIFTAPPHPAWSGAALISRDGRLVAYACLIGRHSFGGSSYELQTCSECLRRGSPCSLRIRNLRLRRQREA